MEGIIYALLHKRRNRYQREVCSLQLDTTGIKINFEEKNKKISHGSAGKKEERNITDHKKS